MILNRSVKPLQISRVQNFTSVTALASCPHTLAKLSLSCRLVGSGSNPRRKSETHERVCPGPTCAAAKLVC